MLVQRVITALVLLPLLIGAVWYAPTYGLYVMLSGAALAAAWEWGALMGRTGIARWIYVATTAALLAVTWMLRAAWPWIMAVSAAWWVYATWLLFGFPDNFGNKLPSQRWMSVVGQILFLPTILAAAMLHAMPDGALRLLFTFGLVFAADTGAYLAGRNFGRRKLAPKVSPGKSIEGAIGGLALCAAWALSAGTFAVRPENTREVLLLVLLSLVVAMFSIVGDLTESMFKRLAGIKDSGNLLPGHGGALDRVDSLLAALPLMALGLHVAGL
jgi:phosphatidate cytidylyltransferase